MKCIHVAGDIGDFETSLDAELRKLHQHNIVSINYSSAFSNSLGKIIYSAIIVYR